MKRLITIALIISTLFVCAACQPTPEKPAVQSKRDGEFEKALDAEPTAAIVQTDRTVNDELTAKDKDVTISVKATVNVPDGIDMIQVPEVTAQRFDNAFVQRIVDALFGDMEVYDYPKEYSKELISARMKQLEDYMTDEHMDKMGYDDATRENLLKSYKSQYELLRKAYKDAPEEFEKKKSDLKLKPHKYYMSDVDYKTEAEHMTGDDLKALRSDEPTEFKGRCFGDDGYIYDVSLYMRPEKEVIQTTGFSFCKSKYYYPNYEQMKDIVPIVEYGQAYTGTPTEPLTITEDAAQGIAMDFLDKIGYSDDFTIISLKKQSTSGGQEFYNAECRRTMGGIVLETLPEGGSGDEYRPRYYDEDMDIYIGDDGVMWFTYRNPLKVQRIVNEGVGIKSFDEVKEIFREQSALTYDTVYEVTETEDGGEKSVRAASAKVSITSIDFKVMRVAEKDKMLTYLVAPVWTFSGQISYYDENGAAFLTHEVSMTVNAVDGSIVSASDCY